MSVFDRAVLRRRLRRLEQATLIDAPLASRLVRAAGFRNIVAHAYETLDMVRVHAAARNGPADLLAFLAKLRDHAPAGWRQRTRVADEKGRTAVAI